MKKEDLGVAMLPAEIRFHQKFPTKAYWFKAWGIMRQSGIFPFFAWATAAVPAGCAPSPKHKHLLTLCGVNSLQELFATEVAFDMALKSRLLEAISAFENFAEGARTDDLEKAPRENCISESYWRYA